MIDACDEILSELAKQWHESYLNLSEGKLSDYETGQMYAFEMCSKQLEIAILRIKRLSNRFKHV